MPRRWRGVLVQEGVQTGDGRVIAEGAITWAELPLPLAWLESGDQHVGLLSGEAPVVGTITSITRSGNDIVGEGELDDANPAGAEVIRMLDSGTAPGGSRFFVSIDADDWEVEIIATDPAAQEDVILLASGTGPLPAFRAAAGDPDPGSEGGDGAVLFEDAADAILERATRLRIRGATLCAVSAFDGAFIELLDETTATEPVPAPAPAPAVAAVAHPVVAHAEVLTGPPEAFFADPQMSELQRWTSLEPDPSGWTRVYGHLAGWGECHIGYPNECLTPEMLAEGGYAYATPGHIVCAGGGRIATGPLTVKGGHAGTGQDWDWRRAQAHYDDPEAAIADVAYGPDDFGIWYSGAIRPAATPEQVYTLRASGVSGDWRKIGGLPRLIGACCVNTPGYPKMRVHLASGELVAVIAAGGRPQPAPELRGTPACDEEAHARLDVLERRLSRIEGVTTDAVFASLDSRVRP